MHSDGYRGHCTLIDSGESQPLQTCHVVKSNSFHVYYPQDYVYLNPGQDSFRFLFLCPMQHSKWNPVKNWIFFKIKQD